jgi:segregation and condensation protein B
MARSPQPESQPNRPAPLITDAPTAKRPHSLDAFTNALSGLLGPPVDDLPEDEAAAEGEVAADETTGPQAAEALEERRPDSADDCCPITPTSVLEALLFVGRPGNQPLKPEEAAELIRGVEPPEVERLVAQLNERYEAEGAAYAIVQEAGGFRLSLRPEHQKLRQRVFGRDREAHLSQAAIEVLAMVAYNQPLSSNEINRLRGRPSMQMLSQLVRRQLLRIERPADKPRATVYYTTGRFLKLFGLASIDELPQTKELEQ